MSSNGMGILFIPIVSGYCPEIDVRLLFFFFFFFFLLFKGKGGRDEGEERVGVHRGGWMGEALATDMGEEKGRGGRGDTVLHDFKTSRTEEQRYVDWTSKAYTVLASWTIDRLL